MSPETSRVRIADEAINRVPSNGAAGVYAQPRRSSQPSNSLKENNVSEKDVGLGGDDRDLKKAQVN